MKNIYLKIWISKKVYLAEFDLIYLLEQHFLLCWAMMVKQWDCLFEIFLVPSCSKTLY